MSSNDASIEQLEEGATLQLDFSKVAKAAQQSPDVIPVAVQDADSKEVILVAYVNEEALQRTIKTRIATFWSTSRRELWIKGETSGNHFDVIEIRVNCEQNSLLYVVRPKGAGICHTKNVQGEARNCYYRKLDLDTGVLENQNP